MVEAAPFLHGGSGLSASDLYRVAICGAEVVPDGRPRLTCHRRTSNHRRDFG
jgi:hypothetical protein